MRGQPQSRAADSPFSPNKIPRGAEQQGTARSFFFLNYDEWEQE
jgi:hypothetical protein